MVAGQNICHAITSERILLEPPLLSDLFRFLDFLAPAVWSQQMILSPSLIPLFLMIYYYVLSKVGERLFNFYQTGATSLFVSALALFDSSTKNVSQQISVIANKQAEDVIPFRWDSISHTSGTSSTSVKLAKKNPKKKLMSSLREQEEHQH